MATLMGLTLAKVGGGGSGDMMGFSLFHSSNIVLDPPLPDSPSLDHLKTLVEVERWCCCCR